MPFFKNSEKNLNIFNIRKRCPQLLETKSCHLELNGSHNKTSKLRVLENSKICVFDLLEFRADPCIILFVFRNVVSIRKPCPLILKNNVCPTASLSFKIN